MFSENIYHLSLWSSQSIIWRFDTLTRHVMICKPAKLYFFYQHWCEDVTINTGSEKLYFFVIMGVYCVMCNGVIIINISISWLFPSQSCKLLLYLTYTTLFWRKRRGGRSVHFKKKCQLTLSLCSTHCWQILIFKVLVYYLWSLSCQ